MIRNRIDGDPMDDHRFPAEVWRLVERYPSNKDLGLTETLFSVGNGYLGIRGNPEEGRESATRAPSSTDCTRPGRSGTPRTPTVSRGSGRP